MHSRENQLILLFVAILLLITFSPIYDTGFTTADDAMIHQMDTYDIFASFESNRRPTIFLGGVLSKIAGYNPDHTYRRVLAVSTQIVILFLFYLCVLKLSDGKFALFSSVFVLIGLQNAWNHHTVTAFLFVHHAGFVFFLISLYLLIVSLQRQNHRLSILSGVFFLLSVSTYELFVPFIGILLFVAILISLDQYSAKDIELYIHISKYMLSIVIFTLIYLCVYLYFYLFGSYYNYEGTLISFSLKSFLSVLHNWSASAIPPKVFQRSEHFAIYAYEGLDDYIHSSVVGVKHLNLQHFLKGLIASALAVYFFPSIQLKKAGGVAKAILIGLIIGLSFYGGNVLHAISARSEKWVLAGVDMFSGTYYSLFGFSLGFVVFIAVINGAINKYLNKYLIINRLFVALVAVFVFSTAVKTGYSNYYVGKIQAADNMRWHFIERYFKSDIFKEIPENAIIYAPNFWGGGVFQGLFHPDPLERRYWSTFLFRKMGLVRTIIGRGGVAELRDTYLADRTRPVYYASYLLPQNGTPKIIIGRVNDVDEVLKGVNYSSDVYIFSHARSHIQQFLITFKKEKNTKQLLLNSLPYKSSVNEKQTVISLQTAQHKRILPVRLSVQNGEVDLDKISTIGNESAPYANLFSVR